MAMTVGELCEALHGMDSDMLVVLARDEEGNGYHPLEAVDATGSAWDEDSGEIGLRALNPTLEATGYSADDVVDGPPCVVLWP